MPVHFEELAKPLSEIPAQNLYHFLGNLLMFKINFHGLN